MRITTVQQAFEEFERAHVRVPEAENALAKGVQAAFRAAVKEALGDAYADSFLAGSYRRRTQAVHLKDLDIIVVLKDPTGGFRASASATLVTMKHVAKSYDAVGPVKVKCRAVECELNGYPFWIDLVPALEDGDGLLLAYVSDEESADEWRSADPNGQIRACQSKNEETEGAYIPVTRICKYWNSSFVSSPEQQKPLPSYLVEAILFDALSGSGEWADLVLAFFENAHRHLSMPQPSVPCPGNVAEYVNEMLEDGRRVRALAKVEVALEQARAAVAATNPAKAMDAWAMVFGQAFPAPSTHPNLVAGALRNKSATLLGSGVTASSSGRRPIPARSHGPVGPHS